MRPASPARCRRLAMPRGIAIAGLAQRSSKRRAELPVTASWSTKLPDRFARIGISRGPPRGQRGYRMYAALAPGPWFRSVDADEYCRRYMLQLAALDAAKSSLICTGWLVARHRPCSALRGHRLTRRGAIGPGVGVATRFPWHRSLRVRARASRFRLAPPKLPASLRRV